MRITHRIAFLMLAVSGLLLMLAGCTLANGDQADTSPVPSTRTPEIAPSASPSAAIPTTPILPTPTDLHTDVGPFTDATWILDGVCFEALVQMNGESWSWGTPEALSAFFDRVDDTKLCDAPVDRQTFDFTDHILVGTIQTAQGCDAAHRLIDVVQDDAAQTRTLVLALDVRPGCPYELVQLFLVAVPRLPEPYTTTIQLE